MRPKHLYHASTKPDIQVFEPRNQSPRYPGEAPLVFATPDVRVAAMFLAPKDAGKTYICQFGDEVLIVVECSPEAFKECDRGGAIYELPIHTFMTDSIIGMRETEWVSSAAVIPISKQVFSTSFEAMDKYGVEIYFVETGVIEKLESDDDHGYGLLKGMSRYRG